MNAAADRLDDSFPHGTVDGYKGGCKGNVCPAGADHGLSCKKANQLHAGDYRYQKLVKRGMTPGEIADELGLNPDPSAASAKPSPAAVAKITTKPTVEPVIDPFDDELDDEVLDEERSNDPSEPEPTPEVDEDAAVQVPGEGVAEGEGMGHYTFSQFTAGLSQKAAREKGAEIREWMRAHGWPNVRGRGTVPQEALAAYAASFPGNDGARVANDPTHGRVDKDIQERVDQMQPTSLGQRVAMEQTLQERRDATVEVPETAVEPVLDVVDMGERSDMLDETRERIEDQPRPEWGTVAESVDVERARETAARLFLELTDAEAARDRAESALELTLQKWSDAADQATVYMLRLAMTRSLLRFNRDAAHQASERAKDLADQLAERDVALARVEAAKGELVAATWQAERRADVAEAECRRLRALIEAAATATPRRRRRLRKATS